MRRFLGTKMGIAVTLFAALAGAYLLYTHTGHALAAVPYLLLLACPLLHLFGHGHKHAHKHAPVDQTSPKVIE